jgi:hypothetical protein
MEDAMSIWMIVVMLAFWFPPAIAGEISCAQLPASSLSRYECEDRAAKRRAEQERVQQEEQRSKLGTVERGTTLEAYLCAAPTPEIQNLTGMPGGRITGTYINLGRREIRGATVYLQLYDFQGIPVGRLRAPVFPGTIPPAGTGTFSTYLPARNDRTLPWQCAQFTITELADWYTK